jgi:aryl-alcohol dehydrogenase
MEVLAAVCYAKSAPFELKTLKLEGLGADDVLVKIVGSGLCHTDLAARDGAVPVPTPSVLGHEGSGIVEAVGENVSKVAPGDHVVLTYAFCGQCHACDSGHPAYCEKFIPLNFTDDRSGQAGTFYDGDEEIHGHFFGQSSFASFALSHQHNVIKVRNDAPLELLGVLGCGVQTGAGTVMNALKARPGDSIVVFGVGPVGLSAIMAAQVCGCTTIIAVDVLDTRLESAKEFGATHTIKVTPNASLAKAILAIAPRGVNHALDTSGRVENCRAGLDALGTFGKLAFLGVPKNEKPIEADMFSMLMKGQSMMGVVEGDSVPEVFIPKLIDLYLAGKFPFDRMITKYDFRQINQAIEDQEQGKVIKVVFTFAEGENDGTR